MLATTVLFHLCSSRPVWQLAKRFLTVRELRYIQRVDVTRPRSLHAQRTAGVTTYVRLRELTNA